MEGVRQGRPRSQEDARQGSEGLGPVSREWGRAGDMGERDLGTAAQESFMWAVLTLRDRATLEHKGRWWDIC